MRARYSAGPGVEALLDPDGAPWQGVRSERLKLIGTPIGLQPTPAIQVAWAGKQIGAIGEVAVAAVHDGQTLAFRLEWSDAVQNVSLEDTTAFPDAAAVLLPAANGAPMVTMGAVGLPVNAWYWRADETAGRHVVAEGLGTSRTLDQELVKGRGAWKDGRWRVVLARALRVESSEPLVQLEPGGRSQYGVAVWEGGHGERAGIKAFSVDWQELVLDAATTAGR